MASSAELAIQIAAINRASAEMKKIAVDIRGIDSAAGGSTAGISKLDRNVAGLTGQFDKARNAARQFVGLGAAAGIGVLAVGLNKAAKAASNLQEAQSKANVTFGKAVKDVDAFAKISAKAFGVSERAALEYSATLANILQASGLTKEETAGMSVELTKLAADIASFNNLDFDVALEKIRAGLVGEAEPLRTVGVLLSEAAVKQKAYTSGIAAAGSELTEAQKVQARYKIILEQTANAQGDFARTADGAANQQRIFRAEMENTQAIIGRAVLPVLTSATKALNEFLAGHQDDIERLSQLFAENLTGGIEATGLALQGLADAGSGISEALGGISGGIDELEVAGIAGAAAFAWLFPGAALVTGIAAVLVTIGLMTAATDDASDSALRFKATWLSAVADVIDSVAGLGESLAEAAGGFVFKKFDPGEIPFTGLRGGFDPEVEEVGRRAGAAYGKAVNKGISEAVQGSFTDRLRAEADAALAIVDDRTRAAEASSQKFATQMRRQGEEVGSTATQADRYAAATNAVIKQLDAAGVEVGDLGGSYKEAAKSVKDFHDLFDERTLEDITLERQIADIEALISGYEAAGKDVPAALEEMREALQLNRRASDDLAQAAGLNFEELRTKLIAMGQDGSLAVEGLTRDLEGLPEDVRIEVVTFLNRLASEDALRVAERLVQLRDVGISIPVAYDLITEQGGPQPPRQFGSGGQIPEFATGGIGDFGGGRLAMLHGREAVLPLDNPVRAGALLSEAGLGGGNIAYITINSTGGQSDESAARLAREVSRILRDDLQMQTLSGPRLPAGAFSPRRA